MNFSGSIHIHESVVTKNKLYHYSNLFHLTTGDLAAISLLHSGLYQCSCVLSQVPKTCSQTAVSCPAPPWTWSPVFWTSGSTLRLIGVLSLGWLLPLLLALSLVH